MATTTFKVLKADGSAHPAVIKGEAIDSAGAVVQTVVSNVGTGLMVFNLPLTGVFMIRFTNQTDNATFDMVPKVKNPGAASPADKLNIPLPI